MARIQGEKKTRFCYDSLLLYIKHVFFKILLPPLGRFEFYIDSFELNVENLLLDMLDFSTNPSLAHNLLKDVLNLKKELFTSRSIIPPLA